MNSHVFLLLILLCGLYNKKRFIAVDVKNIVVLLRNNFVALKSKIVKKKTVLDACINLNIILQFVKKIKINTPVPWSDFKYSDYL